MDRKSTAQWSSSLRSDIYKHTAAPVANGSKAKGGDETAAMSRSALRNISNQAATAPAAANSEDSKEREARRKDREDMLAKIKGDRAKFHQSEVEPKVGGARAVHGLLLSLFFYLFFCSALTLTPPPLTCTHTLSSHRPSSFSPRSPSRRVHPRPKPKS